MPIFSEAVVFHLAFSDWNLRFGRYRYYYTYSSNNLTPAAPFIFYFCYQRCLFSIEDDLFQRFIKNLKQRPRLLTRAAETLIMYHLWYIPPTIAAVLFENRDNSINDREQYTVDAELVYNYALFSSDV